LEITLHRTARSIALCPLSGIRTVRVPRGGWRREDPSNGGDGGAPGHNNGGGTDDSGKAGDDNATDDKAPKIDGDFDAERAKNTIAAARQAEAKAKADKKAADERVAAVLKAAGLTPDGKTDPAEQLKAAAAERDAATAKARETAVELAVYKSASKAGGDPDALLDSRGFQKAVADLDPDAADFGDKVTAAIKAAVKANPKLSTAPAGQGPGKQGADHSGSGGGQSSKPKTLTDAIAAKLGGQ
jgi:hypothetical protein